MILAVAAVMYVLGFAALIGARLWLNEVSRVREAWVAETKAHLDEAQRLLSDLDTAAVKRCRELEAALEDLSTVPDGIVMVPNGIATVREVARRALNGEPRVKRTVIDSRAAPHKEKP